jgi:transcriptional repressor NrdR
MRCSSCSASETRVLDSRERGETVHRRRECQACGQRFPTYERIDLEADELERAVVAYVLSLDRKEAVSCAT